MEPFLSFSILKVYQNICERSSPSYKFPSDIISSNFLI